MECKFTCPRCGAALLKMLTTSEESRKFHCLKCKRRFIQSDPRIKRLWKYK